jgi:hypothetical protein
VPVPDLSGGGGYGGSGCGMDCPPLQATPELESIFLFGGGLSALAGYTFSDFRAQAPAVNQPAPEVGFTVSLG